MPSAQPDPEGFDPESIIGVLFRHKVRYVLIGGIAAILHGSPLQTNNADICPARNRDNLDRLAAALDEMGAYSDKPAISKWAEDPAEFGAGEIWNLRTRFGRFDIVLYPAGTRGYEDLVRDAVEFQIGKVVLKATSLPDIIRSKNAAGRPKDRLSLPALRELLDRLSESRETKQ